MVLLGAVVVALVFALTAFWPAGNGAGPRVVEPTAAPTPADPRVGQGKTLATTFGCVACHSADGSRSVGPTWRGLYGAQVQLESGQTVQADDAYLTNKIRNPDQVTVAGYPKGVIAVDEATPFFTFDGLRRAGNSYTFVNAVDVTAACRMIKSEHEIALMQTAKNITLEAHKAAARIMRECITTTEVQAFLTAAHRK